MGPNSILSAGARITSTFYSTTSWLGWLAWATATTTPSPIYHLATTSYLYKTPFSPIYPVVCQQKNDTTKRFLEVSHPCGARGANFDTISLYRSRGGFQHLISTQKYHTARLGVTPSRAEADTQRMAFVYPAVALHLARNDTHCIGVARHLRRSLEFHLISRHLFSGFPTRTAGRFCHRTNLGQASTDFTINLLDLWPSFPPFRGKRSGSQKEKRLPLSRHI